MTQQAERFPVIPASHAGAGLSSGDFSLKPPADGPGGTAGGPDAGLLLAIGSPSWNCGS